MAPTKSTMLWMLFLILCWKELKTKGIYEYFFLHVSFGYVLCFPLFSCNKSVYLSVIFVFFFNGGGIMGQGGRNALRRGFCHCLRIDVVKLSDVRGLGPIRVVEIFFQKIYSSYGVVLTPLTIHYWLTFQPMTTFHDGKVTGNGQKSNLRWKSGYRCWCMWWKIGLGKRVIYKKEIKNAKKGFCTLKLLNFIAIWWGLTPARPVVQQKGWPHISSWVVAFWILTLPTNLLSCPLADLKSEPLRKILEPRKGATVPSAVQRISYHSSQANENGNAATIFSAGHQTFGRQTHMREMCWQKSRKRERGRNGVPCIYSGLILLPEHQS